MGGKGVEEEVGLGEGCLKKRRWGRRNVGEWRRRKKEKNKKKRSRKEVEGR